MHSHKRPTYLLINPNYDTQSISKLLPIIPPPKTQPLIDASTLRNNRTTNTNRTIEVDPQLASRSRVSHGLAIMGHVPRPNALSRPDGSIVNHDLCRPGRGRRDIRVQDVDEDFYVSHPRPYDRPRPLVRLVLEGLAGRRHAADMGQDCLVFSHFA